ncbi:membrane protein [Clostridium sp. K25]|uniref:CdaR family protein n=1 Tax=Clostridium sp. K25 TaxID=1443109 RepID=UPI0004D71DB8|nr:CdaR family protein [Clostridium sp. K25]KEI08764.1 membrane protein [Clostridium sp. K25]
MDKQSQQKTLIIKICCVIAAFILWLYTSNDGNTIKTNKISNIPVEIINSDYLKQSGFVLSPNQDFTTTLKITGKPADVYAVKPENFKLQVDLSVYALKKGDNKVPITIVNKPNSNVSIKNYNSMWVNIKVDNYKEKNVPIEVMINGSIRQGTNNKPILKIDKAVISGAEEYVNLVVKAVAFLKEKDVNNEIDRVVSLKAIDKDYKEINEVSINPKRVKVFIPVNKVKQVAINIKTIGSLPKDYTLQGLKVLGNKVTITGNAKALSQIEKIDTEPVNLNNLTTESSTIKVKLVVPEGIKIDSNIDTVDVEVKLDKLSQHNITGNLEINNLSSGLTAKLDRTTISLVISGGRNTINELISKGIKCYVNLNGLGKGEHKVPINIDVPKKVNIVSQSHKFVKVIISDNQNNSENTGKNNNEEDTTETNSFPIKKHK